MIMLITYIEDGYPVVSHGVDMDTFQNIILPAGMHPERLGGKFSAQYGEWILWD